MKKISLLISLLVISLVIGGCNNGNNGTAAPKKATEQDENVELIISAAISLTDALEEIKELYEQEHDVNLTFNLGGSGNLAQQIQQGAPVDVFISANQEWMNKLEDKGLLVSATRKDITGNKLVLITGSSSDIAYETMDDIASEDVNQIAIGNPESVPAGKYTEQLLHKLKKWDAIKNKLILAKDVRQVLTYVETGNVDIGFVYESDALTSDNVKILANANSGLHDPIIYPAAVLAGTKHEKEATDFVSFMATDQAQKVLDKYGFSK